MSDGGDVARQYIEIANRLRLFAEKRYNRNKDLAADLEMSPSGLSQAMSGTYPPGEQLLIKLARLGCNVHWLLTGVGDWQVGSSDMEARRLSNRELLAAIAERMAPDE